MMPALYVLPPWKFFQQVLDDDGSIMCISQDLESLVPLS